MTSDDHELDDEAPPEIPDIDSSPSPALASAASTAPAPAKAPPPVSTPSRAPMRSGPELTLGTGELDIDVELDEERESAPEVEPEPVVAREPSRRERNKTAPQTPVARGSAPPPPPAAPAPPIASRSSIPAPLTNPAAQRVMTPSEPILRSAPPPPRARMHSTPDLGDDEPEPITTRQPSQPQIVTDGDARPRPASKPEIDAAPARPPSVPPPRAPMPASLDLDLETELREPPRAAPPRPASVPPPPPRPVAEVPRPASVPPPPPRPVSEPPRRRSEPPPPPRLLSEPPRAAAEPGRALEPPRPVSEPPRPVSEPPRPVSEPPAAKPSSEPPGSHAATSYPPPAVVEKSEEDRPAAIPPPTAIKAARIISVKPSEPQTPLATSPEPAATEPAVPRRDTPLDAMAAVVEEIPDEDIAPDSGEVTDDDIANEAELRDVDMDAEATPVSEPLSEDGKAKPTPPKPPPRPKREGREPMPTIGDTPRSKQRRAWWEDLFGEDFQRATARLQEDQIKREVNFVEESLGVAPGGVVLDLGCGSGQHAVELARRGYGVVGYDLSLFQLALAAEVAQESGQKLNLLQGDMREMAFEEMFDGIFCWNTTFGYFEEEKNFAVAQRVFRALRPGGMFLLDVVNRDYAIQQSPSQTWFEGDACVCMDDMSVDFITSRLKVKRSLILDDGRTRECVYSIRLYSLHELGKLLHDVGFRVTEASGHPATPGVFFGAYSPRIIILAQRP